MISEFLKNNYLEESAIFNQNAKQIQIFTEAAFRENEIDVKQAELRVMQENGTYEDQMYLEDAAKEGLVARIIEAIKKMAENVKQFFANLIAKFKEKFFAKKQVEKMNKIDLFIAKHPILKRKKVSYRDNSKDEKFLRKSLDETQKKKAKLLSGHATTRDIDDVNTLGERIARNRKKIIAGTIVTVSLVTAVVLLKKGIQGVPKAAQEAANIAVPSAEAVSDLSPDAGHAFINLTNIEQQLRKEAGSAKYKLVTSISSAINTIMGHIPSENLEDKKAVAAAAASAIGESAYDYDEDFMENSYDDYSLDSFDPITESVYDTDDYFSEDNDDFEAYMDNPLTDDDSDDNDFDNYAESVDDYDFLNDMDMMDF